MAGVEESSQGIGPRFSRREAIIIGATALAGLATKNMLKPSIVFAQGTPEPTPVPSPEPNPLPSPEVVDNSQWTKIEVASVEDLQQDNWQMASWGSAAPRVPRDDVVNEVLASQYKPTDIVLDASGTQFFPEEVDLDDPGHGLSEGRNMVFPYRPNLSAEGFGTVNIPVVEGQEISVRVYTEGLPARYRLIPAELFEGSTVNGYYLQIDGTGNASKQARRSGFESIDNTPIPQTDKIGDDYVLRGNRRDFLAHINIKTATP